MLTVSIDTIDTSYDPAEINEQKQEEAKCKQRKESLAMKRKYSFSQARHYLNSWIMVQMIALLSTI